MIRFRQFLFAIVMSPACGAAAQTLTTLHSFSGGADGGLPYAGVVYEKNTLYGTTGAGGGTGCGGIGCGTIFKLRPATGVETIMHSFAGGTDGAYPNSALTVAGNLYYGTTYQGGGIGCGGSGCGTVFAINPAKGTTKLIYRFNGGSDGAYPVAGLVYDANTLYGATTGGGAANCTLNIGCGTLFAIDIKTGAETILYSFRGGADGANPFATPVEQKGYLYGTTAFGGGTSCNGNAGCGTAFAVNPKNGKETVLHSFAGGSDGATPYAAVTFVGRLLYGTTYAGGASAAGVVYRIDPATKAETQLYSFTGGADGCFPVAALARAAGQLYGTTINCGATSRGTIFTVDPATSTETTLYAFTEGAVRPTPNALLYKAGNFYGTTQNARGAGCAGSFGCGTVFEFSP